MQQFGTWLGKRQRRDTEGPDPILLYGARRSGKSYAACVMATAAAVAIPYAHVLCISPWLLNVGRLRRNIEHILGIQEYHRHDQELRNRYEREASLHLANGSLIEFLAEHQLDCLSYNADLIVLDDARNYQRPTYAGLLGARVGTNAMLIGTVDMPRGFGVDDMGFLFSLDAGALFEGFKAVIV